ncbi:restriction endonuclease [Vagococcus fluvialis]|uniref:Restriction endonuclease n=1 Tax=Vagococcus fluvialis TaxID=2738 RepID=A0A7X6D996_9ENTE|nr:restriction endonuclease [Vagococcus fluvialis]NKC68023.1 restriction endonuclease [Vagococcus fluvialis]
MWSKEDVSKFILKNNYDIRKSNNGRWIDQKCTPDVVTIVSDCILEFTDGDVNKTFTIKDIWNSDYTENNVYMLFNKPSVDSEMSRNEYDKFFSQPIKMLSNAGLLYEIKKGKQYNYRINNFSILEFISLREKNSLFFLQMYIEKVLRDSEIWIYFNDFFINQDSDSYNTLKEKYENFIINNTKINKKTEVRRIFTKVINPLANKFNKRGTKRGRLSNHIITYAELMYNQENFRDIYSKKPKNITREQWLEENPVSKDGKNYYKYQSIKAKRFLHKYNIEYRNGKSEYEDRYSESMTVHMHHIFPEHKYPEISMYYENIIALTPSQHYGCAHPKNNTHLIDITYQELLLKAKVNIIEENINLNDEKRIIYNFDKLVEVLNYGFDGEFEVENKDFSQIFNIITNFYLEK